MASQQGISLLNGNGSIGQAQTQDSHDQNLKVSSQKVKLAGPLGFEPRAFSLEAHRTGVLDEQNLDWVAFRKSLESKKYHGSYASQLFSLCVQYSDCLLKRDLSRVKTLSANQTPRILKALSALAKYMGIYEEYRQLVRNYGLSWVGRSNDDYIIERMNATNDPEEIWRYIRDVKECRPEFSLFMDFLTVTGLRYSEAVNSYNLIIQLTKEGKLATDYLNPKTMFLEHFRFKETFIRSCKKAFVSYAPLELLERIGASNPIPQAYAVKKRLSKRHVPQRFKAVRSLNGTFMTKYLKEVEIDLLQGRISGSVFRTHYYSLNLVNDLRQRLNNADKEILEKISFDQIACLEKT